MRMRREVCCNRFHPLHFYSPTRNWDNVRNIEAAALYQHGPKCLAGSLSDWFRRASTRPGCRGRPCGQFRSSSVTPSRSAPGHAQSLFQHLVGRRSPHRHRHPSLDWQATAVDRSDPHRWADVSLDGPRPERRANLDAGAAGTDTNAHRLSISIGANLSRSNVLAARASRRLESVVAPRHLPGLEGAVARWPKPSGYAVSRRGGDRRRRQSAGARDLVALRTQEFELAAYGHAASAGAGALWG